MRDRQKRLNALGYRLVRHYYCPIRRKKMPYATQPVLAGGTCVFERASDVDCYILQVEQVREWQREAMQAESAQPGGNQ